MNATLPGTAAHISTAMEIIKDITGSGERVVVFSKSIATINKLTTELHRSGISYVRCTSDLDRMAREEAVRVFNRDPHVEYPGPSVFLGSALIATGINLGANCHQVINMDLPTHSTRTQQMAGRVWKSGRAARDTINVEDLIRSAESVEKLI
jgi:superfamily II DNA/RNA helicase